MTSAPAAVPHDVDAEEAIIASILVADDKLAAIRERVGSGDFYSHPCRLAYDAACHVADRGEQVNQISVANELSGQPRGSNGTNRSALDEVGGPAWLSRIVLELPTPIGAEGYADIVRRDATYRQLISASAQITDMARQGGPEVDEIVRRAEVLLAGVTGPATVAAEPFTALTVDDFLQEEIKEADSIISDGGGGAILSPGEKLMVAGPAGVGKTNIGYNMAAGLAADKPVLGLPCGQRWNVLYVLLEGNRSRQQKRLRKLLKDADPETLRRFHFAHLKGLDLSQPKDAHALEELCRNLDIDVLFIDPFREAHSLGEDKSEDAARIMRVLNGILSALPRLAIVLVHHVRKPDPRRLRAEQTLDQIRGSGHLVAAMQSVLLVNEDPAEPDKLLADWVKHRDAEERVAPMLLYFDRATLTYEIAERPTSVKVTPEAIVTAILSAGGYLEGPTLVGGLMEGAGASERTVRDAIRAARDLNLITDEKVDGSSKKAYRVTLKEEA